MFSGKLRARHGKKHADFGERLKKESQTQSNLKEKRLPSEGRRGKTNREKRGGAKAGVAGGDKKKPGG